MPLQFIPVLMAALARLGEELSLALGLTPPFTAVALRDAVQRWRGYRIDLEPYPMGDKEIYGLCVCKRPGYYVIFYRADATLLQRERIIFHELAHIILSHVSPLNTMHVLRESLAATVQEQEAEIFAAVMTQYALVSMTLTRSTQTEETTPSDRFTRWIQRIGS